MPWSHSNGMLDQPITLVKVSHVVKAIKTLILQNQMVLLAS